jgi:hypothetical protein
MSGIKFSSNINKVLIERFEKQANLIAQQVLTETSKKIQILMTEIIHEFFYNAYSPTTYKRTYKLLNSVTQTKMIKVGNSYQITIFLDPKKSGNYDNGGKHRYFMSESNRIIPVNDDYPQNFDANTVFRYASMGIHGLPADGESGWHNNDYRQPSKTGFLMKLESEIDTEMLLSAYSKALKSNGFKVIVL